MDDVREAENGFRKNIPLRPKAIEIMGKYKARPLCLKRGTVLPVLSNQKKNSYLRMTFT